MGSKVLKIGRIWFELKMINKSQENWKNGRVRVELKTINMIRIKQYYEINKLEKKIHPHK